jgi:putative membrane protein
MPPAIPSLGWQPHPDAWLLVVALAGGYLYALSAWGRQHRPPGRAATRSQRLCFFAGVVVLWLGADWPVHTLAEDYLYSVHMFQHLLFQLAAAPLLLLGTPGWLLRRLLRPRAVAAVWRAVTRPLPALLLMSGYTVLLHWPAVTNTTASNGLVHLAAHIGLVVFALVMWWPVLSPLPEFPHLSYPARMVYLFGHSILPTVPASFLTLAHNPLYEAYARAPRLLPWLDAATDQQIAGLLMKIGGGLAIWLVIAVLFFRWQAEEESGGPDLLYWRDLQPELDDAELSR